MTTIHSALLHGAAMLALFAGPVAAQLAIPAGSHFTTQSSRPVDDRHVNRRLESLQSIPDLLFDNVAIGPRMLESDHQSRIIWPLARRPDEGSVGVERSAT